MNERQFEDGSAEVDSQPTRSWRANQVPAAAVARLSLYLRELVRQSRSGVVSVSSTELGDFLGVSAAVVRRDLAYLGCLGRRGVGYNVNGLATSIRVALGADKSWNVCLVGVGSLGTALIRYRGFAEQGFRLVAAFDVSPERIGCDIAGVPVLDIAGLENAISQYEISLAILAVPADAAQLVAGRLAAAGISGILNFAPLNLSVGGKTWVVNVDLASEMQQLSFAVARQSLLGLTPGEEGVSGL